MQNALYLAAQGYRNVDAFDISEHGIAKLKKRCREFEVPPNAFVAGLTRFEYKKNYDMIMCFGTLHFVEKDG